MQVDLRMVLLLVEVGRGPWCVGPVGPDPRGDDASKSESRSHVCGVLAEVDGLSVVDAGGACAEACGETSHLCVAERGLRLPNLYKEGEYRVYPYDPIRGKRAPFCGELGATAGATAWVGRSGVDWISGGRRCGPKPGLCCSGGRIPENGRQADGVVWGKAEDPPPVRDGPSGQESGVELRADQGEAGDGVPARDRTREALPQDGSVAESSLVAQAEESPLVREGPVGQESGVALRGEQGDAGDRVPARGRAREALPQGALLKSEPPGYEEDGSVEESSLVAQVQVDRGNSGPPTGPAKAASRGPVEPPEDRREEPSATGGEATAGDAGTDGPSPSWTDKVSAVAAILGVLIALASVCIAWISYKAGRKSGHAAGREEGREEGLIAAQEWAVRLLALAEQAAGARTPEETFHYVRSLVKMRDDVTDDVERLRKLLNSTIDKLKGQCEPLPEGAEARSEEARKMRATAKVLVDSWKDQKLDIVRVEIESLIRRFEGPRSR